MQRAQKGRPKAAFPSEGCFESGFASAPQAASRCGAA